MWVLFLLLNDLLVNCVLQILLSCHLCSSSADQLAFYFSFITALIRHNKPAIAAFRLANGYAALRDALSSENVRFQRYYFLYHALDVSELTIDEASAFQ